MKAMPDPGPAATAWRLATVVGVLLMLALRDPQYLWPGRLWGEEATIYFADAWRLPFAESFFGAVQGYYSLVCQVGAELATWVPLAHAPQVTGLLALLVQALPPLLVGRWAARGGWPRWQQALAVLAVLVAQPVHETWLTTTGSQYHLTLAAGVWLLAAEHLAMPRRGLLLVLAAGLSSPQTAALLPVAGWLAWRRPDRPRRWAVGLLVACVVLQAVVHFSTTAAWQPRAGLPPAVALGTLLAKCYAMPLVGPDATFWAGLWLQVQIHEGTFWWWAPLLVLPIVGLAWLARRTPAAWPLLATGHLLLLMAVAGSLGDKLALVTGLAQGRYALAANALHLLALLEVARTTVGARRLVAAVLVVWCTGFGVVEYLTGRAPHHVGPAWTAEVARFRQDPGYAMAVWPEPWRLQLAPEPR